MSDTITRAPKNGSDGLANRFDRQLPSWDFAPSWFGKRMLDLFNLPLPSMRDGFWIPAVEVSEEKNELHVRLDLPGLAKDDVSVKVADDELVITGKREDRREVNESGYYRSERSYGSFERRIPLPGGVESAGGRATLRDGVLEVILKTPTRASVAQSITID